MAVTDRLGILLVDATWQFADDAFNRVIRDMDDKLVGILHLQGAAHWTEWKESTSYVVGDVVRWVNMKSDQYAKCVTAGVSGAVSPTNNVVGSIVIDNTVEWKVCSLSSEGSSVSITIWLSGVNYTRGDFVIYGTSLYRCRVPHASTAWVTDYVYWTEIFSSVRMWQPSIYYFINDTVMYNRMLWQCLQAHTSNATFNANEESKWVCITPKGIEDWATSTNYEVDDIVIYNNILYRCIVNHTSDSADFMNDRAVNWKLFHTPNATINNWTTGNYYESGQMVYYENRLYKCISSHMATTFSADFNRWQIEYSNIKDWTSSVYYKVGTTVLYNNIPYKCVSAHTSSTFTNDESNWEIIYSSIKLWSPSTFYKEGIVILNDGNFYRCITAHTSSNSFSNDIINWVLVGGGNSFEEWTPNTSYTQGDYIIYDGVLYKVDNDFTSGTTFSDNDLTPVMGEPMDDSDIDGLWI